MTLIRLLMLTLVLPFTSCDSVDDCNPDVPCLTPKYCDAKTKKCVTPPTCTTTANCAAGYICSGGSCSVNCYDSSARIAADPLCNAPNYKCNKSTYACVLNTCAAQKDCDPFVCGSDKACHSCNDANITCPTGFQCATLTGACTEVTCTTNDGCIDQPVKTCNLMTHKCEP
jgi:hypothetical protein